jgi:hypothetical protein
MSLSENLDVFAFFASDLPQLVLLSKLVGMFEPAIRPPGGELALEHVPHDE